MAAARDLVGAVGDAHGATALDRQAGRQRRGEMDLT